MPRRSFKFKARLQSGAVLLVSMIMLLLLTLIGVTGMRVSNLEEKMAGNAKEINLAFQAAETTLRAAERQLNSAALPNFNNTGGYYSFQKGVERWSTINWVTGDSVNYPLSLGGVSGPQARYIVEELPAVQNEGGSLEGGVAQTTKYYQITTRAIGPTNTSVTVLQGVYKR